MVERFRYVKPLLFLLALALIVWEYITSGRSWLDYRIGAWTIGLAALSFLFVLEGYFRGTPGASQVALVYVLWPLAYMIWIAGLTQERVLSGIDRVAVVSTLFIGAYGCLYLLTELKIIPEIGIVSALSFDWDSQAFNSEEGFTWMQFAGLNSLPFLLPYVMSRLALSTPNSRRGWRGALLWAATIVGIVIAVAASRRALLLLVGLTPAFILFFRSFQPEAEKKVNRRALISISLLFCGGIVLAFIALGAVYRVELSSFWDRFISGFDLSALSSDESGGGAVRREQLMALVRGWSEHPLLGAGHGATAVAYGSIRSDTMPWAYELSYLALLYQIGMVGVLAYAAGVVWIFRRGIGLIREGGKTGRMMIHMLVGLSGALLCHATNPYMDRWDSMWMIFLPLAVINFRMSISRTLSTARLLASGSTVRAT